VAVHYPISDLCFDQYAHLAILENIIETNSELASALGKDYIVKPDIVVGRLPVTDTEINQKGQVLDQADPIAKYTSFRHTNSGERFCMPAFPASGRCEAIEDKTHELRLSI